MPSGDVDRSTLWASILGHLPEVLLVLDANASITYAAGTYAPHVALDVGRLVGRNVWELVHPDDLIGASEALFQSEHWFAQPIGPMLVRYFDDDGNVRVAEAIGMNGADDPELGGFVLLFRDAVAAAAVDDATSAAAEGEPLEVVATHLLRATGENPFTGGGWVLGLPDGPNAELTVVAETAQVKGLTELIALPGRWLDALSAGETVTDHELRTVPEQLATALRHRGLASVLAMPVHPRSPSAKPPLAIVALDPWGEPANMNQLRHLERLATVLDLALQRTNRT